MKPVLKLLVILHILLFALLARSNDFIFDFGEGESLHVTCKELLLLTHPSAIYDILGGTEEATAQLVKDFQENHPQGIRLLLAGSSDKNRYDQSQEHYYVSARDIDYTYCSQAGEHKVFLGGIETLYLVGGYWEKCLLQSLRYLLFQNQLSWGSKLKVIFVTDAIFTSAIRQELPMSLNQLLRNPNVDDNLRTKWISQYLDRLFENDEDTVALGPRSRQYYSVSAVYDGRRLLNENKKAQVNLELLFLSLSQLKKMD